MSDKVCGCCGGTGVALDIEGNPRPCAICRHDDFSRWYRAKTAAAQAEKDARRKAGKVGK